MAEVITGLSCPNCSGTLSVREGQRIVKCPYCQARSLVRGDRGVARYQVARRIDSDRATAAVRRFWSGLNRALDLAKQAQISELFLVYLPYWRAQAQLAGWVFGQKKIRSGKTTRYEPREVQLMENVDWTGAAGDVAEFGVERISLQGAQYTAYDPNVLHAEGLVFEPTGSNTMAVESASDSWNKLADKKAGLDQVAQKVLHFLRQTVALVYYPLWVARYTYRHRSYQVVVDGYTGQVLYGKAPGNIFYRALMLVAGTSVGAFIIVDGTALAASMVANSDDGDSLLIVILPIVVGAGIIGAAYKLFRWGEELEYRGRGTK